MSTAQPWPTEGTTINAVKARQQFGELLDKADYWGESFVIKRGNKFKAAIVSILDYQFIQKRNQARKRVFATHKKLRKAFAKLGIDKTQALIDKAVKQVRTSSDS